MHTFTPHYTRDLPYDFSALVENIVDPAHGGRGGGGEVEGCRRRASCRWCRLQMCRLLPKCTHPKAAPGAVCPARSPLQPPRRDGEPRQAAARHVGPPQGGRLGGRLGLAGEPWQRGCAWGSRGGGSCAPQEGAGKGTMQLLHQLPRSFVKARTWPRTPVCAVWRGHHRLPAAQPGAVHHP